MHATVYSGKLTEVDTEVGTLVLEWTDCPNGVPEDLTFNFGPKVVLEVEWECLMGRKVDVVTVDDKAVRVTEFDE